MKHYLPIEAFIRYETEQAEVVGASSVVCPERGCRVVISQDATARDVGYCIACNRNTCMKCRSAQHKDQHCPTDAERERVLELAKGNKRQLCYQCKNMVELDFDCYHIT